MAKVKTYPGDEIDVTWDGRLCIHIAECGRASVGAFVSGRDPWCSPDEVASEDLAEVCRRCPTGALAYTRKDGQPDEQPDPVNTITVVSRGPLYARGQLDIKGAPDDMPGVKHRAALCRCGQSKNKPFCDNTHEQTGFSDRGAVGRTGEALESQGGTLEITPTPNGSLMVKGNLQIRAGSGEVRWTGTRAFLCRCGQSKKRPFCDGSHKAAGFEAEGF